MLRMLSVIKMLSRLRGIREEESRNEKGGWREGGVLVVVVIC